MHLSIMPMLLLASTVLAVPALQARDDKVVKYNLNRINQALNPLEATLKRKPRSFRNDDETERFFREVYDLGVNVVGELEAGSQDIRRNSGRLTDFEAPALTPQISKMDTSLGNIVTSIVASKRDVERVGRRREVHSLLTRARNGIDDIFDAANSKMSIVSQPVGRGLKAKFVRNLDRGVAAFR